MMRSFGALIFSLLLLTPCGASAANRALTPQQKAILQKYATIAKTLHPQYGDVSVTSINATLHLSHDYYFLPSDQAKRVLVDAWGNSPDSVSNVLGMIFPRGATFADDSWGAVITYHGDGYVSDADARTTDYSKLLQSAREGEDEENTARKLRGYEPVHLVGWAQAPYYDQAHHTLVWARNIRFGDQTNDTLNYDLRALGRRGVLSMNIVSLMSKLPEVRSAAARLQNIAAFDPGARYQDYKAGADKTAEYGVAGLVAAGIGVVAAKKLGLIALGLVFFKKFFALAIAAVVAAGAWFRRMFGGKAKPPTEPPAMAST
jgi:uncharacterized membrane-anchored protein